MLSIINRALSILTFAILLNFSAQSIFADTTDYYSAGSVKTDDVYKYDNSDGCQKSFDGLYCSRAYGGGSSQLYFGNFPQLEEFNIPQNSRIDAIHIRVKANTNRRQGIGLKLSAFNKAWSTNGSSCYIDNANHKLNFGGVDSIKELTYSFESSNYCFKTDHIDYKNFTIRINNENSLNWYADIDNLEIAFDYTPPSDKPIDVIYLDNQKGEVWSIGPHRSNVDTLGLNNIIDISAGSNHVLALKNDGTVWAWGDNSQGQLGTGNTTNSPNTPVKVMSENKSNFLSDIIQISAGSNYGLALKSDGTVWAWGQNSYGLLGTDIENGIEFDSKLLYATQVKSAYFADVKQLLADGSSNFAVNENGKVVSWGSNSAGQLGVGCYMFNCSSFRLPGGGTKIDDVEKLFSGHGHIFALRKDGTIWGWGRANNWELSDSGRNATNTTVVSTPILINELTDIREISGVGTYNLAISNKGDVFEWGGDIHIPRKIEEISNAKTVSVGTTIYSFGVLGHIIDGEGKLWQTYINDISPKVVPVLKDVYTVSSGFGTPAIAVIGNANGEVLGEKTVRPFLQLPWDYNGNGMSFNEAALGINSYFDHAYPVLSDANRHNESLIANSFDLSYNYLNSATTFQNTQSGSYTKHDGYDYGSPVKLNNKDEILAAASGSARYISLTDLNDVDYCYPCGNAVQIKHPQGYQTRYYHLSDASEKLRSGQEVEVEAGEVIGYVGYTGNVRPQGESGSHLHFMVIKDMNNDNQYDYAHDIPYGITDPFGWMPSVEEAKKTDDPWETAMYNEQQIGSKSYYLWKENISAKQTTLTSEPKSVSLENYNVTFGENAVANDLLLYLSSSPVANWDVSGKKYRSLGPTLQAEAFNNLGDRIDTFLAPFTITISFDEDMIYNIDPQTLSLYSSDDQVNWVKEDTNVDISNYSATAVLNHFTFFALAGEIIDTTAPNTNIIVNNSALTTDKLFNTEAIVSFDADDGKDGLGVQYTAYQVNDGVWQDFSSNISLSDEGVYDISYFSEDVVGNVEEVSTKKITIDLTDPVSSHSISGDEGYAGWFISPVSISLSAEDSFGVDRVEYSLDGGETFGVYDEPVLFESDGEYTLTYRAVDQAGNVEESHSLDFKIDQTAPSTVVYTTGVSGTDTWYRSAVTIGLNGQDLGSGYKTTFYSINDADFSEYSDRLSFEDEGIFTISYYSIDQAGNKEGIHERVVHIDKTAPELEISYDIEQLELMVRGIDNAEELRIDIENVGDFDRVYTLTDLAGNTLVMNAQWLTLGKHISFTLDSLQYNDETAIQFADTNFFTLVLTDNNETIRNMNQRLRMKGNEMLFTNYFSNQNETRVTTLVDNNFQFETREGLIGILLKTNHGEVLSEAVQLQ